MFGVADQRTLVGVPAVLGWQPTDGQGIPADPGTVTVKVTRADGTELVAAGTATTGTGTDPRTYTLAAAANTIVDRLTVVWTGDDGAATTTVDVVGGLYLTVPQVRTFESALSDPNKYPDALIASTLREVELRFEDTCHQAFVPTLRVTYKQQQPDRRALVLDRPNLIALRSITPTVDGLDLATIPASEAGIARRDSAWWPCGTLTVHWLHGAPAVPADLKRAAARYVRHLLTTEKIGNGIPDRAISWASPDLGGTTLLATPGDRQWHTAIPAVDEVLIRYTYDAPAVA